MIVWVSSYPRSGNSLAKTMLRDVFLLHGTSRYRETDLAKLAALLPMAPDRPLFPGFSFSFLGPWEAFRDAAYRAPHDIYIKTHEPDFDDSRAIYVVRDPRAALASYVHFLKHHHPELSVTPERVIEGRIGQGSWSAHLDSWQPDRRPHTLLLRYEDMVDRPDVALSAIAGFLGVAPLRPWENRFRELNKLLPNFFRSGSNAQNVAELTPSQLDLIRALHGPWMRRLGYDLDLHAGARVGGDARP
jgi:hypothetical protein